MPHIQIETVTTCNAKCGFCPHPALSREYQVMGMDLYRKIIDEVAALPAIEYIYFVGLGETLLDPHLLERVRYIRERGMSNYIGMFTNGFAATPQRIDTLYETGVSVIHFSLNAVDEAGHAQAMGVRGRYEHVTQCISHTLTKWGPKRVQVCAVDVPGFDREGFKRIWGPFGKIWREDNFAGDTATSTSALSSCDFPQTQINVLHDGRVTTCCMDPTGKRVFGNLSEQSIREVFNSEGYTTFREQHSLGFGKQQDPCRLCSRI